MAEAITGSKVKFSPDVYPNIPTVVELKIAPVVTRLPNGDPENPGFTDRQDASLQLDFGDTFVVMRIPIGDDAKFAPTDDSTGAQIAAIFDTLSGLDSNTNTILEASARTDAEQIIKAAYPTKENDPTTWTTTFDFPQKYKENWPLKSASAFGHFTDPGNDVLNKAIANLSRSLTKKTYTVGTTVYEWTGLTDGQYYDTDGTLIRRVTGFTWPSLTYTPTVAPVATTTGIGLDEIITKYMTTATIPTISSTIRSNIATDLKTIIKKFIVEYIDEDLGNTSDNGTQEPTVGGIPYSTKLAICGGVNGVTADPNNFNTTQEILALENELGTLFETKAVTVDNLFAMLTSKFIIKQRVA